MLALWSWSRAPTPACLPLVFLLVRHGETKPRPIPELVKTHVSPPGGDVHHYGEKVMDETRYGLKVQVPIPYDEAVAQTTDALKAQGFGVLTTIDVKQTLRAKLDRDFRRYVILGACNPPLADRALHADLDIGLLLPCNVVVYEVSPSATVVAAMAPLAALALAGGNPALTRVAREADERLRKALEALESHERPVISSAERRS
jgi:uncharacterized protein (DUF302 family)